MTPPAKPAKPAPRPPAPAGHPKHPKPATTRRQPPQRRPDRLFEALRGELGL